MRPAGAWLGGTGTSLHSSGEFGLIARLRDLIERRTAAAGIPQGQIAVGIGDDAASLVPSPGCETLVTCDIQVAGRHFVPGWTTPRAVGARCATISASDIGAMGGVPRAAVVSLGLGPETAVEDVEAIYEGILDKLLDLRCLLVGGNVTSLEQGLLVDMTVLGEVEAGRAVRRDTGRAGDQVWVTGLPGSAAAGLALLDAGVRLGDAPPLDRLIGAYLEPEGRAREGRALGMSGAVTSMIDVSDGLIGDLTHMVEGRELGVVLMERSVPIGGDLHAAGERLGRPPEGFVLSASDDYEILFTMPGERAGDAVRAIREISGMPARRIGELTPGIPGQVLIEDAGGRRRAAAAGGWDHFSPDS
jgi:thiamine-monophosphate kinase